MVGYKAEYRAIKLPAYINETEFLQIIKLVKKKHHRLAFILGFNSGMRVSEIVHLQPEDVDIEHKRIFVRQGKGAKDRVVPLPKGFPKQYLNYLPLKCGVRALEISFKKYVALANLNRPGLHFHSLRHSMAVHAMERGIPLNQIQLLLGHENISTTSIYLKVNPKDALDNYEKLW